MPNPAGLSEVVVVLRVVFDSCRHAHTRRSYVTQAVTLADVPVATGIVQSGLFEDMRARKGTQVEIESVGSVHMLLYVRGSENQSSMRAQSFVTTSALRTNTVGRGSTLPLTMSLVNTFKCATRGAHRCCGASV